MEVMVLVDVQALRPSAADVELVAGLLDEVGEAAAAELAADLRLTVVAVAGMLRQLEREHRACRTAGGWVSAPRPEPLPRRRSWRQGAGQST